MRQTQVIAQRHKLLRTVQFCTRKRVMTNPVILQTIMRASIDPQFLRENEPSFRPLRSKDVSDITEFFPTPFRKQTHSHIKHRPSYLTGDNKK